MHLNYLLARVLVPTSAQQLREGEISPTPLSTSLPLTTLRTRGLGVPASPVRYAKFESIRYFIDIDILQNCLIDIDIFQNHHIDIDIFGITLSISISISIFFRIALSISISISIFSTSPYRYRYFSIVSIYRQSICHIHISNRAIWHKKGCYEANPLLVFNWYTFRLCRHSPKISIGWSGIWRKSHRFSGVVVIP